MSGNARQTRKIELVETHNIALSLDRLGGSYKSAYSAKRALYHAITMCGINWKYETLVKIREALELP